MTNQLLPVTKYFPLIHQAVQAMARHFGEHARAEPCIARTIAYAELVFLLRAAKAAKATLSSSDYVRSLIARRQRQPLPQYNYTLRSKDFSTLAADTARRLSRTESTGFDGLMATTVGLRYAAQAGDFTTFSTCKQHALKCIARLQTQTFENEYGILRQALPHLEGRIRESCHDTLIEACIEAACDPGCSSEDQFAYLEKAMRLCGSADVMSQNSPTRCRWLEAKSYLQPNFDPVPELAKIRAADPSTVLPFSVLAMVKARRRDLRDIFERERQLDTADLTGPYADLWLKLRDRHSHRTVLSLCKELQRFDLPIQDYLTTFTAHRTDEPNRVLWRLLVARLAHLPATSFSTRFLHRDNPFVASHELLDYETPANLTKLFSSARRDVERFDFLIPREKTGLRKLFSTFLPHDLPDWWAQFLKAHASSTGSEASKTALLLAHELKARGRTVKDLYDQMRQHRTKNPQAGLFLLDLDKTA